MKACNSKKFGVISIVVLMLAAFLSFNSVSAQAVSSDIEFTTDIEDTDVKGLNVDLYWIADIGWDGVNGKYFLTNVKEAFKSVFKEGFVIDTTVTETIDSETLVETKGFDSDKYANDLCNIIFAEDASFTKDYNVKVYKPKEKPEKSTVVQGLYLAIAKGSDENYIKKVDDKYVSYVSTELKEYDFSPYLVFVNSETNVGLTKTNLKYQVMSLADGELIIEKEILEFGGKPVTFVFSIQITDPMDNVREDVASITFNSTDFDAEPTIENFTKRITISNIPVGSSVIVTEVYAGAGYKVVDDNSFTVTVDSPVRNKGQEGYKESKVHFVNTQDDETKSGFGINNEFKYESSSAGWKFVKSSGGSDQ